MKYFTTLHVMILTKYIVLKSQVSEILSDVSRLTINGWFHTSEVCLHPEPSLLEQPISFSALVPLSVKIKIK